VDFVEHAVTVVQLLEISVCAASVVSERCIVRSELNGLGKSTTVEKSVRVAKRNEFWPRD